ncbi:response regulator [Solimicrobium silvestre]|uniref:Response regulator containing a CheY-like receiver domain and an HTH DNA-binding domain n=1 Tax=Solimicrobium silvestre TaxID=2099400 RepID=A0A2S9H2T7_9BURK|nr:response regulator transcription factor [Solimicrobium silvestre]PRC94294.1 Response regulator containing a CheY-like receiver domain and an HTH DNA-binding domain [Solimicrobium silvestre]
MIRILIADDHTLMRDGLKQILSTAGDMIVIGEASNGFQVLSSVRSEQCDLLLLDMTMPGRSGVELIKQIKAEKPKLPILVLSMHKEGEYAVRTIRAGAAGYLCKDSASQQLLSAIRAVSSGGRFISPEVAADLAFGLILGDERPLHASLSEREFQIFRRIAAGSSINDIARRLNLSAKTVSTYKTRVMQKMQMTSVAELIRYGLKHGLVDDSSIP